MNLLRAVEMRGDNFEPTSLDPMEVELLTLLLRRLSYAEWQAKRTQPHPGHAHADRMREPENLQPPHTEDFL